MKKWLGLAFILIICLMSVSAQNVVVSNPIELKNDSHYQIIGEFNNKILLFRGNSGELEVLAFNQDMQQMWAKQLDTEFDNVQIAGIIAQDTAFHVFLAYRDLDTTLLYHYAYDPNVNLLHDKTVLLKSNEVGPRFFFSHSQDRSKVLLFQAVERSSMRLISYDVKERKKRWDQVFQFESNAKEEFRGLEITNKGEAYLVLDNDNRRFDRDEHAFEIFYYKEGLADIQKFTVPFKGFLTQSVEIVFDEFNNELNIMGYYTYRNLTRSEGLFYFSFHPSKAGVKLVQHPWNDSVKQSIYGPQGTDASGIEYLKLKKVIPREDGGLLMIGEVEKIFQRRATFSDRGLYSGSNWVDYIYEDLVLVSLHPDGQWHWSKVLHKRQFSQDDNAIYSSFFLFNVPSFIRIIYNDEISNNSTASAYEVFTDGSYARTSILSTQYQKLQLRFQQALQYSSTALVVPSEYKGDLKLVQIAF